MHKMLSTREKILAIAAIGIVVLVAAFNLFIAPVIAKANTLNKEIALAKLKSAKYSRLLSQKGQLQAKYGALLNSPDNTAASAPDASVSILSELEKIARNANIRIIEVRPQSKASREALIDLRTEGGMEAYIKFLYDVENSLSLLSIRKFQLNARPNTQVLEGVFSISQFSLSE